MPEENKTVDIDTSGPGAEIDLQEDTKENEIEVENETVENNTESNDSSEKSDEQLDVQNQETTKQEEVKQDDGKLEEYSKGVQSRIAKLTRKMREAERREQAAIEYARSVEEKKKTRLFSFSKNRLRLFR
jgi:archaellum component FlaD/FlaE